MDGWKNRRAMEGAGSARKGHFVSSKCKYLTKHKNGSKAAKTGVFGI